MGRAEDNKRDKLERILRAGRELFERRGYAGTTMDDVAGRAGVSKGAIYFHVGSKAGLLNRVFGQDFDRWIDEAFAGEIGQGGAGQDEVGQGGAGQGGGASIVDRLVTVYARLLALMCDAPELTRVYMADAGVGDGRDNAVGAMNNLLGRTVALLDEAKRGGELDPGVDSRHLAYNLWALYFVEQHRWLLANPSGTRGDVDADIRARLERPFTVQLAGYRTAPSGRPG